MTVLKAKGTDVYQFASGRRALPVGRSGIVVGTTYHRPLLETHSVLVDEEMTDRARLVRVVDHVPSPESIVVRDFALIGLVPLLSSRTGTTAPYTAVSPDVGARSCVSDSRSFEVSFTAGSGRGRLGGRGRRGKGGLGTYGKWTAG